MPGCFRRLSNPSVQGCAVLAHPLPLKRALTLRADRADDAALGETVHPPLDPLNFCLVPAIPGFLYLFLEILQRVLVEIEEVARLRVQMHLGRC